MSTSVLEEVRPFFEFLFKAYDFYPVEHDWPAYGDSIAVVESRDFRLRFVWEKGQILLYIGPLSKPDIWHHMDLVEDFVNDDMNLENDYMNLEHDTLEEQSAFLKANYTVLREMFNVKNLEATEEALERFKKVRVRKIFPGLYKDES